ncbi:MAG: LysR substrate-binding domain-containing protein, partial [Pseudomonadota bacterium]
VYDYGVPAVSSNPGPARGRQQFSNDRRYEPRVARQGRRRAVRQLVRPAAGAAGPLLAFRRSCSYRGAAEAWLRATGRADTEIVELGTLDGMIGCVEAGMGIAVLPEQVVAPRAGPGLAVDPLPDAIADTVTHLVWRLDHRPSRVHETLVGLIAGQAPTGAPCASRPAT